MYSPGCIQQVKAMYIHRFYTFISDENSSTKDLKNELKKYSSESFRRLNDYILLSLIGAYGCTDQCDLEKNTSLYLPTESGNLSDTENVMDQLFRDHELPMPFSFINTMSNTAAFYVAKNLSLIGRNLTMSSRGLSFERGLELALVDFESGIVENCLIGGVDERSISKSRFNLRFIDKDYHDFKHINVSAWLYLKSAKTGAIGEIREILNFKDFDSAIKWYSDYISKHKCVRAFGMPVDTAQRQDWRSQSESIEEFDYIQQLGHCDTGASYAITSFLEQYADQTLIHINKDMTGCYVVVVVKKF